MQPERLRELLDAVRLGTRTPEEAFDDLRTLPFEDIGYAHVDHHRHLRQGFPEVIFCQGKTIEQIVGIATRLRREDSPVLATRVEPAVADALASTLPAVQHFPTARCVLVGQAMPPRGGVIAVVSAGTADVPVAEEAAVTAEVMGNVVERVYDVGVAGLHRLLAHHDLLLRARVIIVVAGMEGALPSVVGGLVSSPVIAVPTSIGYGAAFGGLAALLGMLTSCASGVTVVNIDNGFGAGYVASLINHLPPAL